ncbi:hypothetical protein F7Q99_36145 [Streptomyces kaniharaensis]|uniref:Uncharacterized protein n=1 Tax=Streptomyces kaniharaensis TaxID=212423 RepID=A0A6N7L561_9ACTN|nr:hypothetical protein [Streptomyces kaniharaensis]MQS17474.1 hypothetical protein [Streptomyces kaniharaensis]
MTTDEQRLAAIASLTAELRELTRAPYGRRGAPARKRRNLTDDDYARREEAATRRTALLATPPDGYALPTEAGALAEHARAHGWAVVIRWAYGTGDPVRVDVELRHEIPWRIGRSYLSALPGGRQLHHRAWVFRLAWTARGMGPGRMRQDGRGTAEFPDRLTSPHHPAPHLSGIWGVIAAHPRTADDESSGS